MALVTAHDMQTVLTYYTCVISHTFYLKYVISTVNIIVKTSSNFYDS